LENIIKLGIQKMLIDPKMSKKVGQDFEHVDPEQLVGGRSMFTMGQDINAGFSNFGINLNLTFTERVDGTNLESQLDQRKWIADYCFNSLNVSSISFVK
jgi:hypothetical protein